VLHLEENREDRKNRRGPTTCTAETKSLMPLEQTKLREGWEEGDP